MNRIVRAREWTALLYNVGHGEYDAIAPGMKAHVSLFPGALGFRWYEIRFR